MNTQRQLGLCSATALVIANMIGTGVFTTSGLLLADLRSPWAVLGAWTVGGVIALLGALNYGALGGFPNPAVNNSFCPVLCIPWRATSRAGCRCSWDFQPRSRPPPFAFGEYAKPWLPAWSSRMSGTLLLVAFSALHAAHVRRGAWAQNAAVLLKVTLIVLFVGFALWHLPAPGETAAEAAPLSAFGVSLVWISFSYSGWNAAVYVSGEIRDPERNLPRALLMGTALVTLVYLALNAVFVFAAPTEQLAGKLEIGRVAA